MLAIVWECSGTTTTTEPRQLMSADLATADALSCLSTYWVDSHSPRMREGVERAIMGTFHSLNLKFDSWEEHQQMVCNSYDVLQSEYKGKEFGEMIFGILLKANIKSLDANYPYQSNEPKEWFHRKEDHENYFYKPSPSARVWRRKGEDVRVFTISNSVHYQCQDGELWKHSIAYQILEQINWNILDNLSNRANACEGAGFREKVVDLDHSVSLSPLTKV